MAKSGSLKTFDFSDWKRKLQGRKKEALPPTDRALTIREVGEKVGASRSTINRWIKDSVFPAGRKFGTKSIRWLESDIDTWMQSRKERK